MQERTIEASPSGIAFSALDSLSQGIAIFDADLRLQVWNSRFIELRALPPRLVHAGMSLRSLLRHFAERGELGKGDPDMLVEANLPVPGQTDSRRFEREISNGRLVEVLETILPEGGMSLVYTDLTEQRRREHALLELAEERAFALQESEARLKLIADEVPAGIAHIDQQMRFLFTNRRFAAAYGHSPADLVGLSTSDILHPRTLSESARFFEQARRGALVDFEMRVELPGGIFKDVRTLLRPASPSSGEVIGFYLLSIDVTRRKATMSALMGAQKMDALGRMASGISHDFNNLLTIILGNIVPLAEKLGDGELVSEYLAPAISAARRGSSLTQRLLTLARREQYAPEATNITGAVEEICTLLRSSMPRGLHISQESRGTVPEALVDRAQLEMALLNLAMNARDATGGTGHLSFNVDEYQLQPIEAELLHVPSGPYVRIRVADDGSGMTPDQTERIFEPFYTSKAAGAGSGLGLSMVYGFVKQSNGAISVESAPGEGATFTILLPSVELRAEPVFEEPSEPPMRDEAPDSANMPLVLLVDDDHDVRRTIRRRIASLGYPVIEAEDGDVALDLLSRIGFIGIVLSDINMPGSMDGVALSRCVRERFPQAAMILMSGRTEPAWHRDAAELKVEILGKPIPDDLLTQALNRAAAVAQRNSVGTA